MRTRRHILKSGIGILAMASAAKLLGPSFAWGAPDRVTHTDAEWRKLLTPEQYDILRQDGTETPFTSPLLHEERAGIFACAGCALPLYSSKTKYDSKTGWPSFWTPLPDAITTKKDHSYGDTRTAVNCARCDGHLGHVFNDGPPPTGLRYCMDGVALKFVPGAA